MARSPAAGHVNQGRQHMSGENGIVAVRQRLDCLRAQHGPAHLDVVELTMRLAELTGEQGDVRGAYLLYQELGDTLRAQAGPFEGQTLDAYEGMARWIAKS